MNSDSMQMEYWNRQTFYSETKWQDYKVRLAETEEKLDKLKEQVKEPREESNG